MLQTRACTCALQSGLMQQLAACLERASGDGLLPTPLCCNCFAHLCLPPSAGLHEQLYIWGCRHGILRNHCGGRGGRPWLARPQVGRGTGCAAGVPRCSCSCLRRAVPCRPGHVFGPVLQRGAHRRLHTCSCLSNTRSSPPLIPLLPCLCCSGVHTHMTNTRITDPEILERRYPVVLHQFRLRPGALRCAALLASTGRQALARRRRCVAGL